ncbi:M48 family metalloprotease [Sphingomonas sp.]|uniref:M48 family metalloprotease n=1 Tax=Sphingomonas sp. TaxID=28214 RepID=UPI0025D38B1D|nr:M48 family metalloprotease [Sphingomonas sp.]MBV9529111.1 M48 family metalloprotease [Sphingomonas sp.]
MAFDPLAATAQYIDALGPAALEKAHRYTVGSHWMLLWDLVVAAVVTLVIVRSRLLDGLDPNYRERGRNWRAFVVSLVYFLLAAVLTLPWTLYENWFRETSYGRTRQPLGDFVGQLALSTAIGSVAGALFMMALYWLIRRTGRRWWIWSGGLTAVALAFLFLLSPVLVEPLFNRYEPVPPGPVRDAVVEMAGRAGIPPDKIYMYNGSRQSNNFTANAGGVGSTARVAISDVALKSASLDEVRAVTGHEIGHYVLKHSWWGLLFFSVLAILAFWFAQRLFRRVVRAFGSDARIEDARGIPILMFLMAGLQLVGLPLLNTFSRTLEMQADMYSLRTENRPDALSTSLVKTAEYRYPRPGKLEEIIFYDHPSVEARIRNAMKWKATHLASTVTSPTS